MESLVKGFKENKAFRFTSLLVVLLLAITFLAPVIAPYDPLSAVMKDANQAPSAAHLFGTDKLGRDVLSRILYGASYSLTSVIALVACIFVVGTTMGIISGYFGGIVDIVIMRIADMMISFPGVILAIAIAGIMGGSLVNAMIALTAVTWTKYASPVPWFSRSSAVNSSMRLSYPAVPQRTSSGSTSFQIFSRSWSSPRLLISAP